MARVNEPCPDSQDKLAVRQAQRQAAFAALSPDDRAVVDALIDKLQEGINRRNPSAHFGRSCAEELLCALVGGEFLP